ncbi:MAG: pyridoxal-phosphate dependent enzyme [Gemmatimonadota bacterium]|nr:pyridoxal-phosphate dependent enzyme [Gemmatimonadota bacterium]
MTDAGALDRLANWPRLTLAQLPTRLLQAPRLSSDLGGGPIYIKMDAETGFALGGNKVRKLEFELAPARLEGVTHLVTAGGPQSNHCRVTAACAARLGLACVLVTNGPEPDRPTGNALLHRLFGATIETVEDRAHRAAGMEAAAKRIASSGGRALVVPIGASTGLGCLGYATAAIELVTQLDALGDGRSQTVLIGSTSSGGTMAGLLLGLALLGRDDVRLLGVSADAPADELTDTARALAAEGAELLGAAPDLGSIHLETIDDQVGAGYGIPTPDSDAALRDFARLEGVVLDPTYTAKAAAGLINRLRTEALTASERVVFLHSGGAPGLLS